MYFKEHDPQSYRMRYHRTYTVFRYAGKAEEFMAYVNEISDNGWTLTVPKKGNTRDQVLEFPFGAIEPKYHYIAPGFYHGYRNEKSVAYLRRKLMTTLHVGLGSQFQWKFLDGARQDAPHVLKPVTIDIPKALEEGSGALSRTLYLWKNNLYYLSSVVGLKSGKNFVVDPTFKSEIEDCVRGHECSVKL